MQSAEYIKTSYFLKGLFSYAQNGIHFFAPGEEKFSLQQSDKNLIKWKKRECIRNVGNFKLRASMNDGALQILK